MEVSSIYDVTDFKDNKEYEEAVEAVGQEAIEYLRKEYPRYSKFVLRGFEITTEEKGTIFKPVRLKII